MRELLSCKHDVHLKDVSESRLKIPKREASHHKDSFLESSIVIQSMNKHVLFVFPAGLKDYYRQVTPLCLLFNSPPSITSVVIPQLSSLAH